MSVSLCQNINNCAQGSLTFSYRIKLDTNGLFATSIYTKSVGNNNFFSLNKIKKQNIAQ